MRTEENFTLILKTLSAIVSTIPLAMGLADKLIKKQQQDLGMHENH